MVEGNHKILVKNAKIEYKKIGHVECPAFGDEDIIYVISSSKEITSYRNMHGHNAMWQHEPSYKNDE